MSFEKFYCLVPLCDVCGGACWETEDAPHYASEREARQDLAAEHGWRITPQRTGCRFRMLCPRCAAGEDCAARGHVYRQALVDVNSEQQKRWEQTHPQPLEICGRCGRVRRGCPPAPGHPESVTELSSAEEELLTVLDAELFPEEMP